MNIPIGAYPYLIGFLVGFLLSFLLYFGIMLPLHKKMLNKELRERKDQFIALSSHYLLNPITIIQTAVSRLRDSAGKPLTPEHLEKLVDAIFRGQQRLWILAEQFFIVGEIDQNDMYLNLAVADISDVVGSAVAAIDPFAREKQVTIHLDDQTNEVRQVKIDPRRMKQAVIAVLDNAVKFSPEGGKVIIRVTLEDSIFVIQIADEGIGMPDEILSHLAEKFYRGNQIYNFDYEGMGLGLHIAQAIIRLHQGNIDFVSQPKQGTVATIQFPNY